MGSQTEVPLPREAKVIPYSECGQALDVSQKCLVPTEATSQVDPVNLSPQIEFLCLDFRERGHTTTK